MQSEISLMLKCKYTDRLTYTNVETNTLASTYSHLFTLILILTCFHIQPQILTLALTKKKERKKRHTYLFSHSHTLLYSYTCTDAYSVSHTLTHALIHIHSPSLTY